jgi:hypothetical protein
MAAYHHLLVHFPIALWTAAALVILWRALSDGALAQAAGRVLVPLLGLSVVTGLVAYVIGLFVFPFEAIAASPLGRNHLIAATWSLAYWALLFVTAWRLSEAVWEGVRRWIMLLLAALGPAAHQRCRSCFACLAGRCTRPSTCRTSCLRCSRSRRSRWPASALSGGVPEALSAQCV